LEIIVIEREVFMLWLLRKFFEWWYMPPTEEYLESMRESARLQYQEDIKKENKK
jgi:hypothetical protein